MPSTLTLPRFPLAPWSVTALFVLATGLGAPAYAGAGSTQLVASHQADTHQTRVVKRQNLRLVKYQDAATTTGRIRVGLRESSHDDIVIHRPATEPSRIAPLSGQAVLRSEAAFVQDLESSDVLYDKNSDEVRPIASISKLMTALIIAEAGQPMDEILKIADADVDRLRYSRSRLSVGTELS